MMVNESHLDSAFLMTFAHDLRQPLRSIVMMTQRIRRGTVESLGADVETKLDEIVAAARRQEELISSVVEFDQASQQVSAAIGEGRPLALRLAVQTACLKIEAYRQSATGTIRFDAEHLPNVLAPSTMPRVLEKLLHNSLKFRRNGVAPAVTVEATEEENDQIAVRVFDNGLGIERQYRDAVFEPFKRLHAAHEYPGSGLGLSICRRLVSAMPGLVRIEDNSSGEGVAVVVHFPRVEALN